MSSVVLGNTAPVQAYKPDPSTDAVEVAPRPDLGNTTTVFDLPEHLGLGAQLTLVSSVYRSHHSSEKPAWVESSNTVLAEALAQEFGCQVGQPEDWVEGPNED